MERWRDGPVVAGALGAMAVVGAQSVVDFGVELYRLNRRAGKAHCFRAITDILDSLRLQRAGERLWIVLERDDALDRGAVRIEQHQAAFD